MLVIKKGTDYQTFKLQLHYMKYERTTLLQNASQ